MPLSANANALGEGIQIMYVFKSFHKRYYFSPDPVSYPGGPVFFIALAEKRKWFQSEGTVANHDGLQKRPMEINTQ